MKVEILTEFKHGRDVYHPEEVVVSDETTEINEAVLKFWCNAGWAKDLSGAHPTGNPGPNDVVLLVDNVTQASGVEVING